MYIILMSRPSYSGKPTYKVQVNTLSEVAAIIEHDCNRRNLMGSRVSHIEKLSKKERNILWNKCCALENHMIYENDEEKIYSLNNLRRIFRKTYFSK